MKILYTVIPKHTLIMFIFYALHKLYPVKFQHCRYNSFLQVDWKAVWILF